MRTHRNATVFLRLSLLLVISAALTSMFAKLDSALVTGHPAAQEALLAWFKEHASEFDNFSSHGEPVDIDKEGLCEECAWFCVRESSPHEVLYGVGLTLDAPPTSCREGEGVRVFRQGNGWKAEQARYVISLGKPSWQEIVEQLKRGFIRPKEVEVKTMLEQDAMVVVTLASPENPPWSGLPNRYRFSKGTDGLWRGYVSFDPAWGRYAKPEDLLIDFALTHFPALPIVGDCAQAQKGRDSDKVCWTLTRDSGDRRTYQIGLAFAAGEVVEMGQAWEPGWVRIATVDPAAHAAFLAWTSEHGYTNIEPAGLQQEGYLWSVRDSSPNEYLYGLHYPVEGGKTVRVFLQGTEWKAEEVQHWQISVGKPSWQEVFERIRQGYLPGWQVKTIMEGADVVVVALVWPENPPDSVNLNMYRFIRGEDGLWRGYSTYDVVGHPDSSYGTPEDVLIAFALKNFPDLPILGNCVQAQEVRDSGKVCWTLKSDTGDQRTYVIGPAFSPGELVEVERRDPGWWIFPPERSSQL